MANITQTKQDRVLVIEDEPYIREVCRLALSEEGFQIDTVENGDVALNKLRCEGYDLCLIDLRMPTMNGMQFFEQLEIEFPELLNKIVFTTGDLMNSEVSLFLSKSNRPLLPKPFTINELKIIIKTNLGLTVKNIDESLKSSRIKNDLA